MEWCPWFASPFVPSLLALDTLGSTSGGFLIAAECLVHGFPETNALVLSVATPLSSVQLFARSVFTHCTARSMPPRTPSRTQRSTTYYTISFSALYFLIENALKQPFCCSHVDSSFLALQAHFKSIPNRRYNLVLGALTCDRS